MFGQSWPDLEAGCSTRQLEASTNLLPGPPVTCGLLSVFSCHFLCTGSNIECPLWRNLSQKRSRDLDTRLDDSSNLWPVHIYMCQYGLSKSAVSKFMFNGPLTLLCIYYKVHQPSPATITGILIPYIYMYMYVQSLLKITFYRKQNFELNTKCSQKLEIKYFCHRTLRTISKVKTRQA